MGLIGIDEKIADAEIQGKESLGINTSSRIIDDILKHVNANICIGEPFAVVRKIMNGASVDGRRIALVIPYSSEFSRLDKNYKLNSAYAVTDVVMDREDRLDVFPCIGTINSGIDMVMTEDEILSSGFYFREHRDMIKNSITRSYIQDALDFLEVHLLKYNKHTR